MQKTEKSQKLGNTIALAIGAVLVLVLILIYLS